MSRWYDDIDSPEDVSIDNPTVSRTLRGLSSVFRTRKHKDVLLSEPDSFWFLACCHSVAYLEVTAAHIYT